MWVVGEARELADEVAVFISENASKIPQFAAARRKEIVESSVPAASWDNVSMMSVRDHYTARAAKRHGMAFLIRGIRKTTDLDYEILL